MENMSLFNQPDDLISSAQTSFIRSSKLDVVQMDFLEAQTMSWEELFSGFDCLHAITYSSGIGFVYNLLQKFEKAEIIFGFDGVISYSLQEVMAFQTKLIELIRDKESKAKLGLISRVEDKGTWSLGENAVKFFRGAKVVKNVTDIGENVVTLNDYFTYRDTAPSMESAADAVEATTDLLGHTKFYSPFGDYGTDAGKTISDILELFAG